MSTIQIKCPQCGNTDFKAPRDSKTDDIITCAKCGTTTTRRKLMAPLVEKTKADIVSKIRQAFKQ